MTFYLHIRIGQTGIFRYLFVPLCSHNQLFCTEAKPQEFILFTLIVLVDGGTVDRGCIIIINSSLSQPLEQCLLRNDHRGPRLAEYEA